MAIGVTRRKFLKWGLSSLALTAAGGYGLHYMMNVEPEALVLETVEVNLSRLPRAFDGMTLVHLSDLHHGPYVSLEHIKHAVELANEAQPDVIVITGDFIGMSATYMKPCVEALRKLKPRVGTYAVLGNHDYILGYLEQSLVTLKASPIQILRNQSVRLKSGNDQVALVGVDDVWLKYANVKRALAGLPNELCKILLVHEPDIADEVAKEKVDLQLSGHSHGGQIKLPGLGPLILPKYAEKYFEGLYRVGDLQVYTTRGVGLIQPAVRLNCPPEVTVVRLKRTGSV